MVTWCEDVPEEELLKKRVDGVGSILYTLFHIVDVEYSWIQCLKTLQSPMEPPFEEYSSLPKVKDLSRHYHKEVKPVISSWTSEMDQITGEGINDKGETITLKGMDSLSL